MSDFKFVDLTNNKINGVQVGYDEILKIMSSGEYQVMYSDSDNNITLSGFIELPDEIKDEIEVRGYIYDIICSKIHEYTPYVEHIYNNFVLNTPDFDKKELILDYLNIDSIELEFDDSYFSSFSIRFKKIKIGRD